MRSAGAAFDIIDESPLNKLLAEMRNRIYECALEDEVIITNEQNEPEIDSMDISPRLSLTVTWK